MSTLNCKVEGQIIEGEIDHRIEKQNFECEPLTIDLRGIRKLDIDDQDVASEISSAGYTRE